MFPLFKSFRTDRRGNIAIMFSLALVPLALMAGAAIDYSHTATVRANAQHAVDSTALALSVEAPTLSGDALQQKADAIFFASFTRPDAPDVAVHPVFSAATGKLTITATGSVGTSLMQIANIQQVDFSVLSEVASGSKKMEIALVLDNTGSMAANGKIQALVASAHQFVTALQNAPGAFSNIKIAVVPFDTHVNVGTASNAATWIDWTGYNPASTHGNGPDNQVSGGGAGNCYNCGANNPNNNQNCDDCTGDNQGGTGGTGGGVSHPTWKGCLVDRTQPYDVQNTAPTSVAATLHPSADCVLAAILPLTNDWGALHTKIDQMHASGNTDLPIGLVWGWDMLTPNVPLSAAAPPAADLVKVMVFLTDGLNTQNRWTTEPAIIDARTQVICDNIKAGGVKIYTIRVVDGNAALLQSCASSPSMFYDVQQSSQMAQVFAEIAKDFNHLRIAR